MLFKKDIWALIGLLVLSFVIRWPFRQVPLERDEGAYAYIAWQMEQGHTPYKDMAEFTPPVVFFIYEICFATLGHSVMALRLFTTFYVLVVLILFYYLSRKLLGFPWSIPASFFFVYLTIDPNMLSFTSNKEIFCLLPLVLGYLLLLKTLEGGKSYWCLLNGFLQGLGFMLKQVLAFNFIFIFLVLIWIYYKRRKDQAWQMNILNLMSGFGLALLLFIVYFAWHKGLSDFLYWVLWYPFYFSGYQQFGWISYLKRIIRIVSAIMIFSWPIWVLAFSSLWGWWRQGRRELNIFLLWGLFVIFSVASGGRFREHYFILLIPILSVLAAYAMSFWWNLSRRSYYQGALVVMACLPLYLASGYFSETPDTISRNCYGLNPFVEASTLAQYIKAHSDPDDKIFIFGSEPEIYYLSQRASASKFLMIYPATSSYGETLVYQQEIARELVANRPRFIVLVNAWNSLYDLPYIGRENFIFEEVDRLTSTKYDLKGVVYLKHTSSLFVIERDLLTKSGLERLIKEENRQPHIYLFQRKTNS